MTPDSTRPVAYFPRYLTPPAAAAVAEAEAEDLGAGPVPYALTPAGRGRDRRQGNRGRHMTAFMTSCQPRKKPPRRRPEGTVTCSSTHRES